MSARPFKQVDVFTATPYRGNPLAVVLDGTGLDDATMQRFAHWTNLSETTFVLPPTEAGRQGGADYRVRIFTPGGELPFAGHPTLGSCHAWLQAGGQSRVAQHIVQECAVGLVTIRRQGAQLAFAAPPLKRSAPSPMLLAKVAAALGLKPQQIGSAQVLDNGPVWFSLLLDSVQTVLQLTPDHQELINLGQNVGVASVEYAQAAPILIARSNREARAFGAGNGGRVGEDASTAGGANGDAASAHVEVRAFAAPVGINEDPVTGSLNAALAQWLIADGHAPARYVASQGACLGRDGRVSIEQDAQGQVWVGGESVTCIDGSVSL